MAMKAPSRPNRRDVLKTGAAALALQLSRRTERLLAQDDFSLSSANFLEVLPYRDVALSSSLHEAQIRNTRSVLLSLDEDSVLQPYRAMAGLSSPGEPLGGWYSWNPDYDPQLGNAGFAPGHSFGQWLSALAREYAATGDPAVRARVRRLTGLYQQTLQSPAAGAFYVKTRFPAYTFDKLVCGLIDAHQFAHDWDAWATLAQTCDTALPHLPPYAVQRGVHWRHDHRGHSLNDESYTWDEPYTLPENLYLAGQRGAGSRYRELARRYLANDTLFQPLASGEDVLAGKHAYSHVNSLCSAMQAAMADGSELHLRAAMRGFDLVEQQSYATGGWGPDEQLRRPESDDLFTNLSGTHHSFETPCGAYAHTKLTRYLLQVTRDGRYGDSMERVQWNTVLGARPLERDGHAFYYADYSNRGERGYHQDRFPCCSGTLPQIAADYRTSICLRDEHGLYVVQYVPSTVTWRQEGARATLVQEHAYPLEGTVRMHLVLSRPASFALRLRVPAWAGESTIRVNGTPVPLRKERGFAVVERRWHAGDRVELHLPLALRLAPINVHHPDVVALVRGPLVLFPIGEQRHAVTREQLLSARPVASSRWRAYTGGGAIDFVPFTSLGDQRYSTYLTVT